MKVLIFLDKILAPFFWRMCIYGGLASGLLVFTSPHALAQNSLTTEARASELRAVVGKVTTPDRELNIANLEAIAAEGDVSKTQLAIRTALSGEDALLRSVAMRAYLASTKTIVVETLLPPDGIRARDQTLARGERLTALRGPLEYISYLGANQNRIHLYFGDVDVRSGRGFASLDPRLQPQFRVELATRGERITFRLPVRFVSYRQPVLCGFDLQATRDFRIIGSMACQDGAFLPRSN